MVYGKTQTSFRLLTEESSIKWRLPVGSAPSNGTTTGGAIYAGMIVYLDGTLEYVRLLPLDTAMSNTLVGVAMDDYNTSLNETQGSGFLTVVLGVHIGNTAYYSATGASNLIGACIVNPLAGVIGVMDVTTPSSNVTRVGNVLNCDSSTAAGASAATTLTGNRLTYWWSRL